MRRELAEDLTARTIAACTPLLNRDDVPGHVRALTSARVLAVEDDLVKRIYQRANAPGAAAELGTRGAGVAGVRLDEAQQRTVAALAGTAPLVVIEGAAGAGKTTTLAAARTLLEMDHQQLVVVAPTLKAAQVAATELNTPAFSAAWLIHQHGYRWDEDGHWTRTPAVERDRHSLDPAARLLPGDLLLIDEAGMLDQDTARALLTIADETGARLAMVGDRHQLPAVGRGGVLDHAARWAHPRQPGHPRRRPPLHRYRLRRPHPVDAHRPAPRAGLRRAAGTRRHRHPSQRGRTSQRGRRPRGVLTRRPRHRRHPRNVAALNATIRDHHRATTSNAEERPATTTQAGDEIAVGDRIATRRNNRDLDVANRDQWQITGINQDTGDLTVTGRRGTRILPATYAARHVELAYATTTHGAQGETVDRAHFLLGETTGAASAYVAMTRGRHHNTAHLVADTTDNARTQWVDTFIRERADLGPAHARTLATRSHRHPRPSCAGASTTSSPRGSCSRRDRPAPGPSRRHPTVKTAHHTRSPGRARTP